MNDDKLNDRLIIDEEPQLVRPGFKLRDYQQKVVDELSRLALPVIFIDPECYRSRTLVGDLSIISARVGTGYSRITGQKSFADFLPVGVWKTMIIERKDGVTSRSLYREEKHESEFGKKQRNKVNVPVKQTQVVNSNKFTKKKKRK